MMIKRICPLLAMVLLVFSAEARPVTSQEAALVARAWASAGTAMGLRLPRQVASTTAHSVTNDLSFYEVKMQGGGTLLMAADTEDDPIIGFSAKPLDVSAASPLKRFLDGDTALRALIRNQRKNAGGLKLSTSSVSTAEPSESEALWAALLKRAEKPALMLTTSGADPTTDIDDVCVVPMVETQWSQSEVGLKYCYNYYTPNHSVCGCTATALAQVMRFFKYPTAEVAPTKFSCQVEDEPTDLETLGGAFDWDNMKAVPTSHESEAVYQAIGHLTYDAGVALKSLYHLYDTSAVLYDAVNALKHFGYAGSWCFWDEASFNASKFPLNRQENIEKTVYANLDAGRPVELGIYGYSRDVFRNWGGHAIVGDGYGYKTVEGVKTPFVHLNLGWAGADDMWYNLPYIPTGTGTVIGGPAYDFDRLGMALCNIVPEGDDAGKEILSGRTVDGDGRAMAGVTVRVSSEGQVLSNTSDEHGIYSFALEGGRTYTVSGVSADGKYIAERDPIYVQKTVVTADGVVTKAAYIGNSWGNDLMMEPPTVLIGAQKFVSLDRALKAAKDGDSIEIVGPTTLRKSVEVPADCMVVASNEMASACAVTICDGAFLIVTNGVTLTMTNVCFEAEDDAVTIVVWDGSTLQVESGCTLRTIETESADGLIIGSGLDHPLAVVCPEAKAEGATFAKGTLDLDYAVATNCANMLLNAAHTRLGGEAYTNDAGAVYFRWLLNAPVPDEAAVVSVGTAETNYNLRAWNDAVEDIANETDEVDIAVWKKGSLSLRYDLKSAGVTIHGEGEKRPVVTVGTQAGFAIPEDTALTVSNVVFVGSAPVDEVSEMIFIRVNGGELTLEDGAEIRGFTGRVAGKSGVIDLLNGTATMKAGAVIRDCAARGTNGKGGAIYVSCSKDCTLNLEGGTIGNCWAATYGGGVYAYLSATAAYSPFVNVSGELTIADNRSANSAKDDLYLGSDKTMAQFKVVGEVDGKIGITYPGFGSGNAEGEAFIVNGLSDGVSETTLYSFFNDTLDGMIAAEGSGEEAGMLVWAKDPRDPRQCEESEAAAKLIAEDVTFWREVSDALNEATNNCVVEVLSHGDTVSLTNRVVINGTNITLRSELGKDPANRLMRERDAQVVIPSGSELIVTNLDISGDRPSAPITNSVTLFDVDGGKLVLRDAGILYVKGNGCRDANAITVHNDGTLWMTDFAQIDSCYNLSEDPTGVKPTEAGVGGGILIDNATAYFDDAHIRFCRAWKGGGVFACNGSTVYVSGKVNIANNCLPYDRKQACNLELSDDSKIVLTDELTGTIGVTPLSYSIECAGNTNLIATVAYDWSVTSLTNSAAGFERDEDGDVGVAVTNGASALIVWSAALKDGRYADPRDGTIYVLAGEMPESPEKTNPESPVVGETTITILNVKPVDGGLAITVLATEGGKAVSIASEQVAGLFEATTDLGDWTTKKVDLTVESSVRNADGTTTFTVKPAGNPNTAFIRLVQ